MFRYATANDGVRVSSDSRYRDTSAVVDVANQRREFVLWVSDGAIRDTDNYVIHMVRAMDVGRLDRLAATYYDRPGLWWIIADANNLINPMTDLRPGTFIKIPNRDVVNSFFATQAKKDRGQEP